MYKNSMGIMETTVTKSEPLHYSDVLQLIRLRTILSPFILCVISSSHYLGWAHGMMHALALFLANAAIMILNDLQDIHIDQDHTTKKFRLITSKRISGFLTWTLTGFGFLSSIIIEVIAYKITFAYIFFIAIGLTYTKYLKPLSWITKNGLVSLSWALNIYLCGSYLGGALYPQFWQLYLIIFLWGIRYESIKDIEDRFVDKKHGISTLVNTLGLRAIPYVILCINLLQWSIWFVYQPTIDIGRQFFPVLLLMLLSFFDGLYLEYVVGKAEDDFSKLRRIFIIHRILIFCVLLYYISLRLI